MSAFIDMSTPHERFIASGSLPAFKAATATAAFEVACDYALLQLQSEMRPTAMPGAPVDPYIGLDANSQMWGAARVLEILKHLHEAPKPSSSQKNQSLHY